MLSSSYRKIEANKSKTKVLKKEPREMENQRKNEKKIKKMIFHVIKKMILGPNHLETQFGPIYPFFRNHKARPTLHT